MLALEDALLSAYKKQPGAAKYARVDMDRDSADFKVFELLVPPDLEEQLLAEVEVEEEPTSTRRPARCASPRPGDRPGAAGRVPRADRRARRHAGRLRPHRRADRQAGDPPADPRGRARHDVRRVPGPRRRADHRHRPAVRLALHARAAARARRGAAAQVRAGRQRALRARRAHQGRHHRRLESGQGPEHHRLAPLARADPEAVRTRGAEIADSLVEIQNVAREPGYRSKIAVVSHASGVDPVGACVGPRGSRVRMVVSELRGEKIDIIPFNEEPARFVAKALSPARVREVLVDDDAKQATVIVPDDQLSLAIGKEGQNARPRRAAYRLAGWTSARRPNSPRKRRRWTTTRRRCPGAARPSSRTASAARTAAK